MMELLTGVEAENGKKWMQEASVIATQALCHNAHCGTVIVKNEKIIGTGFNAPPLDQEAHRTCNKDFGIGKPKFDKTCCMHAEWRAILDALKNNPKEINGSSLFFIRVDDEGNDIKSGPPYCTVCSRLALDVGIKYFHLYHEEGIGCYKTDEYNKLSYEYNS